MCKGNLLCKKEHIMYWVLITSITVVLVTAIPVTLVNSWKHAATPEPIAITSNTTEATKLIIPPLPATNTTNTTDTNTTTPIETN